MIIKKEVADMSMSDTETVMNQFITDLKNGKFKRQALPNDPPYFDESKESVEKQLTDFEDFLDSDFGKVLNNMT